MELGSSGRASAPLCMFLVLAAVVGTVVSAYDVDGCLQIGSLCVVFCFLEAACACVCVCVCVFIWGQEGFRVRGGWTGFMAHCICTAGFNLVVSQEFVDGPRTGSSRDSRNGHDSAPSRDAQICT